MPSTKQVTAVIADGKKQEPVLPSEVRYRRLFETARDGILILDAVSLKITDANPFMTELLGYKYKEFLGKELWEIGLFSDKQANQAVFLELQQTHYVRYEDLPLQTIAGALREVEFVSNLYMEGDTQVIQCNIRDVTERKRAEQITLNSLREKELLLREVHHRVKNNLAVICSMFYLQSTHSNDNQLIGALQVSQDRVKSMALVHETLYRSDDLAAMDFGDYATALAKSLISSYELPGRTISLMSEVDPVLLTIEQAVPCGLILNELLSNALKHAFSPKQAVVIKLSVRKGDENRCLLDVSDDGAGIDGDTNLGGFGLQVVRSLTKQLDGEFKLVPLHPGTAARLSFKVDQDQQRGQL